MVARRGSSHGTSLDAQKPRALPRPSNAAPTRSSERVRTLASDVRRRIGWVSRDAWNGRGGGASAEGSETPAYSAHCGSLGAAALECSCSPKAEVCLTLPSQQSTRHGEGRSHRAARGSPERL